MEHIESLTYTDDEGREHNAHEYLMKDGNLGVPGGRYGSDTADCAPIALMLFAVMIDGGCEDTVECLDGCMSDVVNSGDEVCWSILDSRHVFPDNFDPADWFDEDEIEYSRELYTAAYCGESATF